LTKSPQMLQISRLRTEKEAIIEAYKKRNVTDIQIAEISNLIQLDDERKAVQTENDALLSQVNSLSKEIGIFFKNGEQDKARRMIMKCSKHGKMRYQACQLLQSRIGN